MGTYLSWMTVYTNRINNEFVPVKRFVLYGEKSVKAAERLNFKVKDEYGYTCLVFEPTSKRNIMRTGRKIGTLAIQL
jgi:hypothetical protein